MLFLGLGTGLGSAMIVGWGHRTDGVGPPSLQKGNFRGLCRYPRIETRRQKKWRKYVADVVARLVAALEPDEVVLGGGNVKS